MGIAGKIPFTANRDIKIWIDGAVCAREDAKISVFDSLVQGGDGVWEGLRVYNGKIFQLEAHLDRMQDSAKAMAFAEIPSKETIRKAVFEALEANGMRNNTHVRLTLSRGIKVTSGMSPHWNQNGPTLIVLPEWKPPVFEANGVRLITSAIRRNTPACLDSKIHHNNLINNILAKIQANQAGVDEALMLDVDGFLSETNACNIFLVKRNVLYTPTPDACLPGITRSVVLQLAAANGIATNVTRLSIAEAYGADELFITGTMGELTPVLELDGRKFEAGPMCKQLLHIYREHAKTEGTLLPPFEEREPDLSH